MAGTVTIEDVFQELKTIERTMVTREDLDALIDTVEILSNPKTMAALRKSDLDIKEGRVKEVSPLKSYSVSCEHDLGGQANRHVS